MAIEDAKVVQIDALGVLAQAMRANTPVDARTCRASPTAGSPDEGLALLGAYLAIEDRDVRQAILDVVRTIGGRRS